MVSSSREGVGISLRVLTLETLSVVMNFCIFLGRLGDEKSKEKLLGFYAEEVCMIKSRLVCVAIAI